MIESIFSPTIVEVGEVILVCDHKPWKNWTKFEPGEVVAELSNGTETEVSCIAVCDRCFRLPIEEIKAHVARRAMEGLC